MEFMGSSPSAVPSREKDEARTSVLTTGQAAKLCAVSTDTVLKWIRKGRLKAFRTAGGHCRINRPDLQEWMASDVPQLPSHEGRAARH